MLKNYTTPPTAIVKEGDYFVEADNVELNRLRPRVNREVHLNLFVLVSFPPTANFTGARHIFMHTLAICCALRCLELHGIQQFLVIE